MNNKSSYQKLKEENKKLRQDIHILVNESKSFKDIELNIIYSRPIMTPILFSSRQKPPFIGGGITEQIQKLKSHKPLPMLNEPKRPRAQYQDE